MNNNFDSPIEEFVTVNYYLFYIILQPIYFFLKFIELGVDGFFTDSPDIAWKAIQSYSYEVEYSSHIWATYGTFAFYILTIGVLVVFIISLALLLIAKRITSSKYQDLDINEIN